MKTIKPLNSYKKSLKSVLRNGRVDEDELNKCLNTLAKGEALDPKYEDHQLKHPWAGHPKKKYREFHIAHRWAVVYTISENELVLYDIGTHKELNIGESL